MNNPIIKNKNYNQPYRFKYFIIKYNLYDHDLCNT